MNNIHDVLVALRRIIRAADIHSKWLVKTAGLTAPQLLLMQSIRDRGDATVGELAKQVNLTQATVTTIVDRLEKRQLVFRLRSHVDKRKVYVYLTEAGDSLLANAPTPLQQQFVVKYQHLEPWEQNMILSALQRVADMMDHQLAPVHTPETAHGLQAAPLDSTTQSLVLAVAQALEPVTEKEPVSEK